MTNYKPWVMIVAQCSGISACQYFAFVSSLPIPRAVIFLRHLVVRSQSSLFAPNKLLGNTNQIRLLNTIPANCFGNVKILKSKSKKAFSTIAPKAEVKQNEDMPGTTGKMDHD
uniref:Uncharacterized protein n=1 Tax=Glossina palpalis gambiensis TaxID=67801 RepID=A0A1B0BA66_9MUSC